MLSYEIEQIIYFRKDGRMQKVDPTPQPEAALPRRKPARAGKLSDEIRIMRTLIRQAVTLADDGRSLDELLSILGTVSRASANLATLLKAEKALDESQSASDYVKAALNEIRLDMERRGIDSILTSGLE
ncbi:MAG: hypothetical protein ACYC6H_11930 [Bellilinea sp.]